MNTKLLSSFFLFTVVLFTACILHADGFISSIFGGGKKDTQFTFRTFFEGDWKLQKKTAIIDFTSDLNDSKNAKSDDTHYEDDEFGDSEQEQGEGIIAPFVVAFYSLRSDNLTSALVGRYYEEEFISKERTRQINAVNLRVRYDISGNSGSFLTSDTDSNDHTSAEDDDEFDVVDDDEMEDGGINSNMATLFDFDFKTLPALLSEGNKKAPADVYMSEGYWHGGEENSWYQFIITRPDQFILTVHPIKASKGSRQASVTIIGTKYFGAGAVSTPSFFQKYFPTMMIVIMMILRHAVKPNPAGHPGARPPMQPPSATAGMKEPTKENQ